MRRPIASRDKTWAKSSVKFLAARGISPNAVSFASVVFALLAAICLFYAPRVDEKWFQIALFCGAAVCIQGRLLCNLFDGMLAVEWGKGSALGAIWNDFPDRPADVLILAGCGFAGGPIWMPFLGFGAAMLALLTAYTRVLGAAIGGGEHFAGPMAKPQRMAIATIACVLAALESALGWPHRALAAALVVVVVGCIWTTARRLKLIATQLSEKQLNETQINVTPLNATPLNATPLNVTPLNETQRAEPSA